MFVQTVQLAIEKGLVNFEVLSIDSVKIRANASSKKDKSIDGLNRLEDTIKEKLTRFMDDVDRDERRDEEIEALRRQEARVVEAQEELRKRIEKKKEGKSGKELEKIEKNEKINLTDFDSHTMQQANGEINPAYSMTTAVDAHHDIITHFQINEEDNDGKALVPVIEGSREKCGQSHEIVAADAGFASLDNYEKLAAMNQEALIPDRRYDVDRRGVQKKGAFDTYHFTYCPETNWYQCPHGIPLFFQNEYSAGGRNFFRYANRAACLSCCDRTRCTKSEYRTITRDKKEGYREAMRHCLSKSENKEKYKRRSHCSESPNGNIKHNLKYRIYMRRGRDKVAMEGSLLCMMHNILKMGNFSMQML